MTIENLTSDGGVTKEVLQTGSGDYPQKGQEVTMLYKGTLLNGSVFDSNQDRDKGFKFTLGVGQVIKGWDIGVATMQQGEQAKLTIQPQYGYGDQSMGDKIPPNSTLIFEVELLHFQEKPKEKWDYTPEERMQMSVQWKQQANEAFKSQDYQGALKHYKKVTEYLEMDMKDSEEARQLRVTCLSNCALVYFKSKDYKQTISYADMVLQNQPNNIKALFRKAQALTAQSNYQEALQILQQALQIEENNNEIKKEIINIKNKIKLQDKKDKNVYANIFKNTFYDDQKVEQQPAQPQKQESEKKHPKDCSSESNPRVFMELQVGEEESTRRIEMELFSNICPRTAENFRALCTGEKGTGKSGKALHYKGSGFHRLIKGFMLQGGDFTAANGTGGESIYGNKFDDEDFSIGHFTQGLLSMANAGPNTNGSQFFITFKETPWLDGKHTVFGQVIQGMQHVQFIENIPTHQGDTPQQAITIADCGQL